MDKADTTSVWQPCGRMLKRPRSHRVLWTRLQDLIDLDWPTLLEQIERKVLVAWLKPGSTRISDHAVMAIVEDTCGLSLQSDPLFTEPMYALGEQVWGSLSQLAEGVSLPPARPEMPTDDDYARLKDRCDAWQDARRAAAKNWFTFCMAQLGRLIDAEVVYEFELGELVNPRLRNELRHLVVREVIDDGYTVGASLFLEPFPGTGFGLIGEVVYVGTAFAHAIKLLLQELDVITDSEVAAQTLAHLGFMWSTLKGFVWAGVVSNEGYSLPAMYSSHPQLWELTKVSLEDGLRMLRARGTESAVEWMGRHRSIRGKDADAMPTEQLIARMERRIAEMRSLSAPLR